MSGILQMMPGIGGGEPSAKGLFLFDSNLNDAAGGSALTVHSGSGSYASDGTGGQKFGFAFGAGGSVYASRALTEISSPKTVEAFFETGGNTEFVTAYCGLFNTNPAFGVTPYFGIGIEINFDAGLSVAYINGTRVVTGSLPTGLQHMALAYDGSTSRFFVNGTQIGTSATTPTWASMSRLGIEFDNSGQDSSYIDCFRVTDACRYLSGFTPPARPLTL